jgi:hypothetical protein
MDFVEFIIKTVKKPGPNFDEPGGTIVKNPLNKEF